METKNVQRRHDLDWLRVLAILSVFVYHSTRFFNHGDWHVKNASLYWGVDLLQAFMEMWMMPLIFVISGASIYYAMRKGGAGKFFKDKVLRLLVPLVVGAFTHASLQVYLERITHGQFFGSYFQFLPHYFEGVYMDVGGTGNFAFAGMHLWYLMILFIFCLLAYPLFRWLKGRGRGVLDASVRFLALPGTMYLLASPLVVLEAFISDTPWDFGSGGWGFLYYLFFFIGGFLLVSYEGLQVRIERSRWVSLGLGLGLTAGYLYIIAFAPNSELGELFDQTFLFFGAWALILAFLGLGSRHLGSSNAPLEYASPAVLPFYILHQTVLLCAGFFILRWDIPDLLKWLLITSSSFVSILALYELCVRRINVMRFLFGMKPLPPSAEKANQPQLSGAADKILTIKG
jgi:glucans biosynthesis protein C